MLVLIDLEEKSDIDDSIRRVRFLTLGEKHSTAKYWKKQNFSLKAVLNGVCT